MFVSVSKQPHASQGLKNCLYLCSGRYLIRSTRAVQRHRRPLASIPIHDYQFGTKKREAWTSGSLRHGAHRLPIPTADVM